MLRADESISDARKKIFARLELVVHCLSHDDDIDARHESIPSLPGSKPRALSYLPTGSWRPWPVQLTTNRGPTSLTTPSIRRRGPPTPPRMRRPARNGRHPSPSRRPSQSPPIPSCAENFTTRAPGCRPSASPPTAPSWSSSTGWSNWKTPPSSSPRSLPLARRGRGALLTCAGATAVPKHRGAAVEGGQHGRDVQADPRQRAPRHLDHVRRRKGAGKPGPAAPTRLQPRPAGPGGVRPRGRGRHRRPARGRHGGPPLRPPPRLVRSSGRRVANHG